MGISSQNRYDLKDIRNRVAHHDRLLVEKHKDVRKLATVGDLCRRLLRLAPFVPTAEKAQPEAGYEANSE